MKRPTLRTAISRPLAAVLCASTIFYLAAMAQAERRLTMTSQVPAAVSSGRAVLMGRLPGRQRLDLAISLPLRNEAELDDLLQRIYDPQSGSYHKYLSVEEFTRRFGPTEADHAAVLRFAEAHGLTVVDTFANRMVVDVAGPAANIEKAFHVTLGIYRHPTEGRNFYAPDREPTTGLEAPLLHIAGLDNFQLPHARYVRSAPTPNATSRTTGSAPGHWFAGSDIRAAYYGSGPLDGTGQSVGLFEYYGYNIVDIQNYFSSLDQPLNVPVVGESVNSASLNCTGSCDDSEQALDIEQAISMAPGLEQVVFYVGNRDSSIFNQMASDNSCKQLSLSWDVTAKEATLDPIFKEMAAQGQSMLSASGDYGSASSADDVWPADDAYVTAVGGTDLTTTGPGGAWLSETGWYGSSGGHSKDKIRTPSYQILKGVINHTNKASRWFRNFPDIAGEGNTNQWACADLSCGGGWGGTSFASPQLAGFIALANQQAVAAGQPTVGFINPALYIMGTGASYTSEFHDIVAGKNGAHFYYAVPGYDLVTGWGSPQGETFINALLGLD